MIDISSLNEVQSKAVEWQDGPLLVLAGPGSGKTKVLTSRIARIISQSSSEHFRILGLTFTNKAAAEMRARIEKLVPGSTTRVLLTTFHSFAGDLLRQHGHLIGLRPDFTILTQDSERSATIDDAISVSSAEGVSIYSGDSILPLITRIIENDTSPDALENIFKSIPDDRRVSIRDIYSNYRKCLIKNNSLDFPSLIAEAVRLLREMPAVSKQVRRIYNYICVDEFQDTNLSQYMLLKHLVGDGEKNLFVVADDDQIIYQWNGASPERLRRLEADYSMSVLQLPTNYRCPPAVIDLANKLIAFNQTRSPNKQSLQASKPVLNMNTVRVHQFLDFEDECSWIAKDIGNRSNAERSRCVILARTRKALEQAVENLANADIPAFLAMRKDEFVSAPFRWLHSVLRLANNPQDAEQARRMSKAFYVLEGLQIDAVSVLANAKAFDGSAVRSFVDIAKQRDGLSGDTRRYLEQAVPLLSDRLDYRSFSEKSFEWFEIVQNIGTDTQGHFVDYTDEKSTWIALVEEIEQQFGQAATTLNVLLQELDMRSKTPPAPSNAIPCFTIHASKGMEFGHVYLIGLVEDQLPSWAAVKKGDQSNEMQEERRNCFVAITRTEDSLTMTYSSKMFGWNKKPSRFLTEMAVI